MKYMKWDDSAVLREFGRIMQEKDSLVKMAQAAGPDVEKLNKEIMQSSNNEAAITRALNMLAPFKADPQWKPTFDAMDARRVAYQSGKSAKEVAAIPVPLPAQNGMAKTPTSAPVVAPGKQASDETVEAIEKTAEQKCYDVTPKEDLIQKAHPQTAYVAGEVVENANEQQKADKEIAQKSAAVLKALYKLAKRLEAEKNNEAYKLVKAAFFEIAAPLKKNAGVK